MLNQMFQHTRSSRKRFASKNAEVSVVELREAQLAPLAFGDLVFLEATLLHVAVTLLALLVVTAKDSVFEAEGCGPVIIFVIYRFIHDTVNHGFQFVFLIQAEGWPLGCVLKWFANR